MLRYPVIVLLSKFITFSGLSTIVIGSLTEFVPQCFNAESPCGKLLSVAQYPTTRLIYVATEDGLYELDNDLHIVTYTTTAKLANGVVNSFITLTELGLVVCRNDDSGSCHFRNINSFDVVDGLYQPGVVSNNNRGGSVTVISWIADGPDGVGVINIALSSDADRNLPTLSTRHLPSKEHITANYSNFLSVLKNKYSTPTGQKYYSGDHMPNLVKPIYGFSTGNYHYLIETQFDERNLKSKLIRICKEDVDYRSYIELPIECTLQDGTIMSLAIAAYFSTNTLTLAFSNLNENAPLSGVCQYNVSDLNERFQERRKECLMGNTRTTQMEWNPNIFCPAEPVSPDVFNLTRLKDSNFCYDLDTSYPLGGRKPIQKDAIFSTDRVVNAITVQDQQSNGTSFFFGDSKGYLVKKTHREGVWEMETRRVFTVDSPFLSPNGLLIDIAGDTLYMISDLKVVKMSTEFSQDPPSKKTPPPNHIATITVFCVFGVAVLIIILALVIFYKRRQKMSWYRKYGR